MGWPLTNGNTSNNLFLSHRHLPDKFVQRAVSYLRIQIDALLDYIR